MHASKNAKIKLAIPWNLKVVNNHKLRLLNQNCIPIYTYDCSCMYKTTYKKYVLIQLWLAYTTHRLINVMFYT